MSGVLAWGKRGLSTVPALLLVLLTCLGPWSGNASAAVTWQAAGTAVNGITTTGIGANPPWPTHAINDIALLFVESTGGQPVTLSVPNGFVAVPNSPQTTGAGTAGTQLSVFWARATSAAMAAPRIASPSDHFYARIITFRGVINTGNPWDVTGGGVKAAASTGVTVTGVTTTVANTLIVQAVARDNDSAAAAFGAQANAALTGITERLDAGTANGNGGGLGVWAGVKATAGATGNTTATVTSSINAFLTIALKPQQVAPAYQAAGAERNNATSVSPVWPAHAINDIALLFVESAGGRPVTLSVPRGFAAVPNSPQATGAGTAGTGITVFWARATSAAMTAPTVTVAGDHLYARIITYRNVLNAGNPWDITGGGVKTPASTSVTVTGVTTTVPNTRIVQAVARDIDNVPGAAFSAEMNVNLTGITERNDAGTNTGLGGGFAVWDGSMAAAGATGDTTATVINSINAFLTIALAPNAPSAPVYQALGGAVDTGLNWPTHAIDDIALLFVESGGGEAITLSVANGFAELTVIPAANGSPQATGAGTAGTRLTVFWARATSAAMVGPTITGPTDHAYAQIITYRGAINTGNPWDVTGGGVKAVASTSVTVTGVTTTVANTLVVQAVARDNDNAGAAFSAQANVNLAPISEHSDAGTATGNGGGFAVWDGAKAAAGATGNTTANVTNSINAFLTIALKPPAPAGPDHYELSLPTASVACLASTATVTACSDGVSPCINKYLAASGTTATLATTAGTLGSTTVTFDATGVASTTLSYPLAADGAAATVTLSAEITPAANPRKCCQNGVCVVANSCATTFNTAGFIFSASAGGVVATIPTQVAGITSAAHYLRAVKTSTTTQACEAALAGANTVNFAYECNNPASCYAADLMSVDGGTPTTIARNNNGSVSSYTPVNLTFDANGNASLSFVYSDVGRVRLWARKTVNSATLAGSSNFFVVAPHHFEFSGVTAAPIKAGTNFSATVKAYNGLATPTVTPSFGNETAPEGVTLSHTKFQPTGAGAANGSFSGSVGGFSGGAANGTNLAWSEVGTIDLTATLTSGSYLGSGLSATGTTGSTGAVGRFIPDHFDTVVTQGCVAGAFTYSGQPFTVQLTAMNGAATPAKTVNYDGSANTSPNFAKALTLSDASAAGVGSLAPTAVAASAFTAGVAAPTPAYTFTTATTAPTTIALRGVDTDGVTSSGHAEGTAAIRSGRVRMQNANGSELLNLPLALKLQHWAGSTTGWQPNTLDTCTSINATDLAFSFPVNAKNLLAACETFATVSGSAPNYTVSLAKPGAGNAGWTDLTLNLGATASGNKCTVLGGDGGSASTANAPWLQYNWTGSVGNPTARATFGVYKSGPVIHRRELY